MLRKLEAKCEWCFSRLKCNKIGAADAIISETSKSSRNNVLESNKQQTRSRLTYLEVSKWEKRYDWCFEGQRTAKVKCVGFSGYKQRNKVCLVSLGGKVQEHRYGWCIFKLIRQKLAERTSLKTSKQQSRYGWCF